MSTIDAALSFISKYKDDGSRKRFHRFEVEVRYKNGNVIAGKFNDKDGAIDFLRGFEPVVPKVE
jgi:hypothetical protein